MVVVQVGVWGLIPYIVLTTLLAPLLLVGPLTKLILINISCKISSLTQNFALSTNLDFLRQKNLISKKTRRFRGPNWPVWLYRLFFSTQFLMKLGWPQRQIFTIRVVFQALSTGDLKSKNKVVQQDQKSKIWASLTFSRVFRMLD